jgi:hypothetical protein
LRLPGAAAALTMMCVALCGAVAAGAAPARIRRVTRADSTDPRGGPSSNKCTRVPSCRGAI